MSPSRITRYGNSHHFIAGGSGGDGVGVGVGVVVGGIGVGVGGGGVITVVVIGADDAAGVQLIGHPEHFQRADGV